MAVTEYEWRISHLSYYQQRRINLNNVCNSLAMLNVILLQFFGVLCWLLHRWHTQRNMSWSCLSWLIFYTGIHPNLCQHDWEQNLAPFMSFYSLVLVATMLYTAIGTSVIVYWDTLSWTGIFIARVAQSVLLCPYVIRYPIAISVCVF